MARRAAWEQTVSELVRERGDALHRYAFLLCGDQEDAADLVQDALARTFGRLRNGFTVEKAEAYVRRAILNANLDRGRRATRWRKLAPLEYRPDAVDSPDSATDQRIDLDDELQKLSPRERSCVVMRYYDDLKVDDIAARLGISAGAVKRYLSDGLAKMALALAEDRAPSAHIDEAEAIRQARSRRRPKTAAAGGLGGLAAIALIVPLTVSTLPSLVGPSGTANHAAETADSAPESAPETGTESVESGDGGAGGATGELLDDMAVSTYPLHLRLSEDREVQARAETPQPIELVLVNMSEADQTVCLSPWSITVAQDGEEVWRSGMYSRGTPPPHEQPEQLAPGEERLVDFWTLPELPAGDYSVMAGIRVSCEGSGPDLVGWGPAPLHVR